MALWQTLAGLLHSLQNVITHFSNSLLIKVMALIISQHGSNYINHHLHCAQWGKEYLCISTHVHRFYRDSPKFAKLNAACKLFAINRTLFKMAVFVCLIKQLLKFDFFFFNNSLDLDWWCEYKNIHYQPQFNSEGYKIMYSWINHTSPFLNMLLIYFKLT